LSALMPTTATPRASRTLAVACRGLNTPRVNPTTAAVIAV
jgi:hypothetical protein